MAANSASNHLPPLDLIGDINRCASYGEKTFLGAKESYVCSQSGTEPFANLMRDCLLEQHADGKGAWSAHARCLSEGGFNPEGWLSIIETGLSSWVHQLIDSPTKRDSAADAMQLKI